MAGISLPAPIVKEVLNKENYKEWSVGIRDYLTAQDLWDAVVTEEEEKHQVWRRKNDEAFRAIKGSCGKEAADLILHLSSAKAAWDKLASEYGSPSHISPQKPDEKTHGYDPQYQLLYKAIQNGDWKKTEQFVNAHPEALTATISYLGKTALQAAASFMHLHIVERLVELMSEEDLALKDGSGRTPLIHACSVEMFPMVKCLVNKNKHTLTIPDPIDPFLPVTLAIVRGHKDMARYLYQLTPSEAFLTPECHGVVFLNECLYRKQLDMVLNLLGQYPKLATARNAHGKTFVRELASTSSIFPSGCELPFFKQWIYNWINIELTGTGNEIRIDVQNSNTKASDGNLSLICGQMDRAVLAFLDLLGINQIYETKLVHRQSRELLRIICQQISTLNRPQLKEAELYDSILQAAESGIPEFLKEVINANPELAWSGHDITPNFFFKAVQFRQAKVFSLIYGFIWKQGVTSVHNKKASNTVLHVAGMLEEPKQLNRISGAALKMQRELQWFEEVERIIPPTIKEFKNKEGMTARDLFTREHKALVEEGEKWMKRTATSCTVVGALIVTIMFAAAFTVPGGNNQVTGYPIFLHKKLFMFFIISDAVSLFSSSTSVLMFLGILTSRYAEDDFLKSLPTKLIIGLSLLFISIATMMAAYCAAVSVMFDGKLWIIAPLILLASVPIGLFVWLQFPLLVEIFISTYRPGIFNRNVKRWF